MKVRSGFVSNSSSSSFIVEGELSDQMLKMIYQKAQEINSLEESENGVRVEETDDGIYITADYDVVEDMDWFLNRHNVKGEWSC